jgi:hypothetical protein
MLRRLLHQSLALLLVLSTFAAPVLAQHRPSPTPPPKPAPRNAAPEKALTFDNLLAADSYKIYGEVKNVGTLVSTGSLSELIDPIMKLADPPKEFRSLVKFINANAEMLADSRLAFASWPARPGIPRAFFAIELATPEDAIKFEPKLNRLLPTLLPTPTPTPSPEAKPPADAPATADKSVGPQPKQIKSVADPANPGEEPKPSPPPFVVTRSGNFVFVSDRPFKFEKLRPADSKLLNEDQNFRQARERFSTEPLFVFINISLPEFRREEPAQKEAAAVATPMEMEAKQAEEQPQEEPTFDEAVPNSTPEPEQPNVRIEERAVLTARVEPAPSPRPQVSMFAVSSLLGLLGGGEPEWPDAVGVALNQEADDYVIRAILIGPQNSKRPVVPFVPQLLAGRSMTPTAPSVLPDETEVFLSMSLDLPKIHQGMLARLEESKKETIELMRKLPASQRREEAKPYDPFAEFETKGGFKIKEELLPALGGEVAVVAGINTLASSGVFFGMPRPAQKPGVEEKETEETKAQKKRDQESMPAVLISVRDRETVRRLMPKVLDGLGIGMANMLATPVRRDDTEMVDFAGAFAYAFVGDFLIISTTPTVRHIIDCYLNHQTLSSNSAYRNFTRWQPAGIVGQVYVSPTLMSGMMQGANDATQIMSASMRDYLLRLNPTPQAISYALSNEGFGANHELHLPKALVLSIVAGAASTSKNPPPEVNESVAIGILHAIASAEETYKATEGNGSYGSMDKLIAAKLIQREMLDRNNYRFEVQGSGRTHFEATATPLEYGKSGRLSFFIDATGVVRSGDHGGGPASAADNPVQ